MKISKKRRRLSGLAAIAAFAVAACIGLPTGAALADTPGAPDWSPLRAFYTHYGVTEAVQEALIAKLQHGETLDSAHADEFAPVSTKDIASASSVTTVATYGDGSILVSSVELAVPAPKGGVHPNAISGCTSTTGSGYHNSSNCSITQGDGTYSIGFKASYTQYPGGAQITAYNSAYATALYGSTTALR